MAKIRKMRKTQEEEIVAILKRHSFQEIPESEIEKEPYKYNFGLRWRPWEWLHADLSYQQGNQVGLNVSMPFEVGRPMIPIYYPPYREHPQAAKLPIADGRGGGLSL
ncbi:MAG: YjbH domain-containing protein [Dehalococcoidales bacterium]|nr:YjbH domain-containing protein [Dehalococcoidales bacterium]